MKPPVKREWPKMAHGPLGNSAVFACRGDVPHGWTVVGEAVAPKPEQPVPDDMNNLLIAREQYKAAFGKKAHHTWSLEAIRQKIAVKA